MTETKTKSKAKPKRAKAKPKKQRAKSQRTKAKQTKKPARAKPKPQARELSNGKVANGRATLPLVAGGAALVGAAGGVALGAAKSGSRVLGVRLPHPKRVQIRSKDLSKAAKRVGSFGDQVGDLTAELRSFRRGAQDGNANSPLEILLKGLTDRR